MTHQPTLPFSSETQRLIDAGRVHARKGDPYTSDQALRAIARNGTLMNWIWLAAQTWRANGVAFNDTQLTEWVEIGTGKRQQRNVIARARGLLEDAGMLRQAGVRTYRGRELMHYTIESPYHRVIPAHNKETK